MTHRLGCGIKTSIFQCKLLQHTGHRITCSSLLLHMASVNVLIAWSWTVMTWTLWSYDFIQLLLLVLYLFVLSVNSVKLSGPDCHGSAARQSSANLSVSQTEKWKTIKFVTKWWRRMDWYSKIEKIISTMIYIDESKNYVDYVMAAWWKSNKQYFSFDRYVSEYMILYL